MWDSAAGYCSIWRRKSKVRPRGLSEPDRAFGDGGFSAVEMVVEEGAELIEEVGGNEDVRAILGGQEGARDAGPAEGGVHFLRLGIGDKGVLAAEDDQEGRIVRGDVGVGRGGFGFGKVGAHGAAEQFGDGGGGVLRINDAAVTWEGKEVAGTREIGDAGDFGNRTGRSDLAVQIGDVLGGAEQADEMAAGGDADEADAGGIDAVVRGVSAEPAEGGFAVVDLRGPLGLIGEAVVQGSSNVGAIAEEGEDDAAVVFAAPMPTAAVDEDDEGQELFRTLFGNVEIELLAGVTLAAVIEVAQGEDAGRMPGGGAGGGSGALPQAVVTVAMRRAPRRRGKGRGMRRR